MSEEFVKENDYTLSFTTVNGGTCKISLTKIFNFKSAQVTTLFRESIHNEGGKYIGCNQYSQGYAALTSQMHVESMKGLPSYEELKFMHQKLIDLGGTPPDLSTIIPTMDKKPSPLERRG